MLIIDWIHYLVFLSGRCAGLLIWLKNYGGMSYRMFRPKGRINEWFLLKLE